MRASRAAMRAAGARSEATCRKPASTGGSSKPTSRKWLRSSPGCTHVEARATWQRLPIDVLLRRWRGAQKDDFVRRVVGTQRRDDSSGISVAMTVATRASPPTAPMSSSRSTRIGTSWMPCTGRCETMRIGRILPLVVDLGDPSPAIGWRNAERATLLDRGSPDLVLCLALVHHLSISGNVPLREVVRWLRALDSEVVSSSRDRGDPMVQRLLGAKRDDAHPDYTRTVVRGAARLELQDRRVARAYVRDADAVPRGSGMTAPLSRTSPRTTSVTTKWGRPFASS